MYFRAILHQGKGPGAKIFKFLIEITYIRIDFGHFFFRQAHCRWQRSFHVLSRAVPHQRHNLGVKTFLFSFTISFEVLYLASWFCSYSAHQFSVAVNAFSCIFRSVPHKKQAPRQKYCFALPRTITYLTNWFCSNFCMQVQCRWQGNIRVLSVRTSSRAISRAKTFFKILKFWIKRIGLD